MGLIRSWGDEMYKWRKPIQTYMGTFSAAPSLKDLCQGIATGASVVTFFYAVLWFYGFGSFAPGNVTGKMGLHAVGLGLAVGFVEELLFRGFMQKELERDFKGKQKWMAKLTLAFIFAAMHLSSRSFFGLLLLSLCLSEGKRVYGGDLSYSAGLHSSLVATNMLFNVGNAFVPSAVSSSSAAAPLWLAGHSAHGPHSGLLGMGLLGALCLFLSIMGKKGSSSISKTSS
jgi:hypothetical protein